MKEAKQKKIGKELDRMYTEAKTVPEYEGIVQRREEVEGEISEVDLHEEPDKFGEILSSGYWGEYYYWLKGFIERGRKVDEKKVKEFLKKVSWFWRACKSEVAFSYGDLLSTGYHYLIGNKKASLEVFKDLKQRAEDAGNRVALLRVINRAVTREMKEKNWQRAIENANKVGSLLPRQEEKEIRHFGNIFNNRGASKIRGDVDAIDGARDLLLAADYYLQEEEPLRKHLDGLRNRLREAKEKLSK